MGGRCEDPGELGSVSPAVEGGPVLQTVQSKHTVCRCPSCSMSDDWGPGHGAAAVAGAGRLDPSELAVVLLLAGMS